MAFGRFNEVIGAIYSAAMDPGGWSHALERIADHVGGTGALLVRNDYRTGGGAMVVARLREDLSGLYLERHAGNALVMAVAERGEIGKALLSNALIDAAAIRRSEFHADILAPQAIAGQLVLPHHSLASNGSTGGFGVTLDDRQLDDGRAAAQRLTQIAPHLTRALDLSIEIAQHRDENGRLATLLDLLPTAAMLLDERGRITRANPAAEALLRAGDGLTVGAGGVLRGALPESDRRLRKTIGEALAFRSGALETEFAEALPLHRGTPVAPQLVLLTPLPPAQFRFFDIVEAQAALLVRVIDPTQPLGDGGELLRQTYGLTAAEARVAVLVARGMTTPAVANALGLAASTVRTHLSRSFDKTGTRSQVALARLLNAIGWS